MSVSSVSAAPPPFQPNPQDTAFRSAVQSLTSAISSGDLTSAQTAYSALTALQQQSGAPQNAPGGDQNPFSQLLTKIGGDLSSGNISGAQSDLASFQKAAASHHHRHHGGPPPASDAAPAATTPTTTTSTSTNAVDITA